MKNNGNIGRRLTIYFVGLFIMTIGIALAVKSGLGVTPICAIPYTLTLVFGMDLGLTSMIFSIAVALLQIPILRSKYKKIDLLQIPISIVFGFFVSACVRLMQFFPDPANFVSQFLVMLLGTVLLALGVFLYVSADYVPQPPEGLVIAITEVSKARFPAVKVICDVAMVAVSLITCLIVLHELGSVGLGTVVAAFLVGIEVKFFMKHFGRGMGKSLAVTE